MSSGGAYSKTKNIALDVAAIVAASGKEAVNEFQKERAPCLGLECIVTNLLGGRNETESLYNKGY